MQNYCSFIFIVLLLIVVQGKSQTDTSSWMTIQANAYKDYNGANDREFTFQEVVLSKGIKSSVITGHYTSKQSLGIKAHQLGLNYYNSHKKGYIHLGGYYSKEEIFPRLILDMNVYQLLSDGIILTGGIRHMKYADENEVSIFTLGTNIYFSNFLLSYGYSHISSSENSHKLSLRKYFSDRHESVEIIGFLGGRDIRNIDFSTAQNSRLILWMSVNKKIGNNLYLKGGLGVRSKNDQGHKAYKIPYHLGLKFIIGQ